MFFQNSLKCNISPIIACLEHLFCHGRFRTGFAWITHVWCWRKFSDKKVFKKTLMTAGVQCLGAKDRDKDLPRPRLCLVETCLSRLTLWASYIITGGGKGVYHPNPPPSTWKFLTPPLVKRRQEPPPLPSRKIYLIRSLEAGQMSGFWPHVGWKPEYFSVQYNPRSAFLDPLQ